MVTVPQGINVDETSGFALAAQTTVSVDFGGDGPGTIAPNGIYLVTGATSGSSLYSNGVLVTIQSSGSSYTGYAGGNLVFLFNVNSQTGLATYTQVAPLSHSNASNANDVIQLYFGVTATDADGDTANALVQVSISDDAPVATLDTAGVLEGASVTGNVRSNDVGSNDGSVSMTTVAFDGVAHALPGSGDLVIAGTHGTLTIRANGGYTYVASDDNPDGVDQFTYTLTDGDGDRVNGTLSVTVTGVEEAPVITSGSGAASIALSVAEGAGLLTDIAASDPENDTEGNGLTYSILAPGSGGAADGARFTVDADGGELSFVAPPDFETPTDSNSDNVYRVTVRVTDSAGMTDDQTIAVTLTDTNDAPTLALTNLTTSIAESTDTSARVKLADVAVVDDALGVNTVTLSGADAALVEYAAGALYLKAGAALDFETNPTLSVTLSVDDSTLGSGADHAVNVSVAVADVNEAPVLGVTSIATSVDESADTSARIKLADVAVTDDALGANQISITGADAGLIEVSNGSIYLKAGSVLDRETNPSLDFSIQVDDASLGSGPEQSQALSIAVMDINDAPDLSVSNVLASLAESTDTSGPIKLADYGVIDDALGSYAVSLSGRDAGLLELSAGAVWLKAGVALDHETQSSLAFSLSVDDPSLGSDAEESIAFAVAITDVNEAPAARGDSVSVFESNLVDGRNQVTLDLLAANGSGGASDGDPDAGDSLRVVAINDKAIGGDASVVTLPSGLSLAIDPATGSAKLLLDGACTYLGAGQKDVVSFTYTIADADGLTSTATATITITGLDTNDRLAGTIGADTYFAGLGDDTVFGGSGNDWLDGGTGADNVYGNDGNDRLIGGAGRDTLTGGAGRDRFDFNTKSETTNSARDKITDFKRNLDDIDVAGIDANTKKGGNQAFAFIGEEAFTKTAGELHTRQVGSKTFVEGDINGDGHADFAIEVNGTADLVKGDFIL